MISRLDSDSVMYRHDSPAFAPSSKNCMESVVFPDPGNPISMYTQWGGSPPRRISSMPTDPVRTSGGDSELSIESLKCFALTFMSLKPETHHFSSPRFASCDRVGSLQHQTMNATCCRSIFCAYFKMNRTSPPFRNPTMIALYSKLGPSRQFETLLVICSRARDNVPLDDHQSGPTHRRVPMSVVESSMRAASEKARSQVPSRQALPQPKHRVPPTQLVKLCYTLVHAAEAVGIRDLA